MPKRATAAATLLIASLLALAAATPAAARSGGARWPSNMEACNGATAIVVASDPAAQSDVYSAVTLAGVLGTSCLIDAGARTAPMPAASVALLDTAAEDVYVMGGTAAVPDTKLQGRKVHRSGGADSFATARLAGRLAQDIAQGNMPTFQTVKRTPAARCRHLQRRQRRRRRRLRVAHRRPPRLLGGRLDVTPNRHWQGG